MSDDIDVLRENIIQAARQATREEWKGRSALKPIREAVDAYDAALKPDPWQLLEMTVGYFMGNNGKQSFDYERVKAALLWRKENPDE